MKKLILLLLVVTTCLVSCRKEALKNNLPADKTVEKIIVNGSSVERKFITDSLINIGSTVIKRTYYSIKGTVAKKDLSTEKRLFWDSLKAELKTQQSEVKKQNADRIIVPFPPIFPRPLIRNYPVCDFTTASSYGFDVETPLTGLIDENLNPRLVGTDFLYASIQLKPYGATGYYSFTRQVYTVNANGDVQEYDQEVWCLACGDLAGAGNLQLANIVSGFFSQAKYVYD